MSIKAIVFDMDDTLYAEQDYVISGFKAVSCYVQARYDITGFLEIAQFLFRLGERQQVFNKVLDRLGFHYDEAMISDLVDCYRMHTPEIQLMDDARWVLDRLAGRAKVGLLSDGYYLVQQNKLNALNIKERFDAIVLSDVFGRSNWKPSPLVYEEVSRQLGVPHHECMYVGDNAAKDFVAANRLGWTTVHIQREQGIYPSAAVNKEYEAQYRIHHLSSLIQMEVCSHLFVKDGAVVHGF